VYLPIPLLYPSYEEGGTYLTLHDPQNVLRLADFQGAVVDVDVTLIVFVVL
jgi:hypothetical protein